MDSLKFHWRNLVSFVLELYSSSTGVPLENLRSTGAPADDEGKVLVEQPLASPGSANHSVIETHIVAQLIVQLFNQSYFLDIGHPY